MKFDIYISRDFKGGQFFKSFHSDSVNDIYASIKDCWYQLALSNQSAEAFLFADVTNTNTMHELGTFAFDSDADFSWEMNLDDTTKLEGLNSMGYECDTTIWGKELFDHFLGFLLSR